MRSHKIKAFKSFIKAKQLSRQKGFNRILTLSLMNRSHIRIRHREFATLLRETIATFTKLNDSVNLANNQFRKALADLYKVLSWSTRQGFTDYETKIYDMYTTLFYMNKPEICSRHLTFTNYIFKHVINLIKLPLWIKYILQI